MPSQTHFGLWNSLTERALACIRKYPITGSTAKASNMTFFLLAPIWSIPNIYVHPAATTSTHPWMFSSLSNNCFVRDSKKFHRYIEAHSISLAPNQPSVLRKDHTAFPTRASLSPASLRCWFPFCSACTARFCPPTSNLGPTTHAFIFSHSTCIIRLSITDTSSGYPHAPGSPTDTAFFPRRTRLLEAPSMLTQGRTLRFSILVLMLHPQRPWVLHQNCPYINQRIEWVSFFSSRCSPSVLKVSSYLDSLYSTK